MLKQFASITLVFFLLGISDLGAHFLWKINTETPSFLYGTIHSSDPRVSVLPPEVTEALEKSTSFHPEIEFSPENMGAMAAAIFGGGSADLQEQLPPRLWERMVAAGNQIGMPASLLRRIPMKIAPLVFASPPGADFNRIIDVQVYQLAKERGLEIHSLETVEEQMAVFRGLTREESLKFLEESLDEFEKGFPSLAKTVRLYAERDLDALHQFLLAEMKRAGAPALLDKLLYDRNAKMAERLLPFLQNGGGAFTAVGVGHMPGENGLIALIEKEGFSVTPVLPATQAAH